MTEEKRKKIRDNFNTALLCGLVCIVVGHLHSFFGDEDKVKEYETKTTTKQYTEKEIEDKIQELINKNLQPILKNNGANMALLFL